MASKALQVFIQLEQFALTDLVFHLIQPGEKAPGKPGMLSIGYGFEKSPKFPAPYRLVLRVEHVFKHSDGAQFLVTAAIIGFFKFPDAMPEENRLTHLKQNGLTMLYGSLRGLLLSFSGAFPPGVRCTLPTVNMIQVVADAEVNAGASETAAGNVAKSGARATRKKEGKAAAKNQV